MNLKWIFKLLLFLPILKTLAFSQLSFKDRKWWVWAEKRTWPVFQSFLFSYISNSFSWNLILSRSQHTIFSFNKHTDWNLVSAKHRTALWCNGGWTSQGFSPSWSSWSCENTWGQWASLASAALHCGSSGKRTGPRAQTSAGFNTLWQASGGESLLWGLLRAATCLHGGSAHFWFLSQFGGYVVFNNNEKNPKTLKHDIWFLPF